MTICFVAGKSGGHLLPCITHAKKIYQQNPQAQLYVFTSGSELDKTILQKNNFLTELAPTTLDNPPYDHLWMLPWFAIKTAWYFTKSLYLMYQLKPDKIISYGGFISLPVILAAKTLRIPVEIYELNVQPGKATMFLSKIHGPIFTCFQKTRSYLPKNNCIPFDYPVRFNESDLQYNRSELLKKYNFEPNRKTVLILGGSQGSILLNQVIKDCINQHSEFTNQIQIIHQTGQSDPFDYAAFYAQHRIPHVVFGYHEKLQNFYNLADVIVSRAGAGTLFEIKFFNKPCICVPHQTAHTNHQIENVLELAQEFPNQFYIIEQSKFDATILLNALRKIIAI